MYRLRFYLFIYTRVFIVRIFKVLDAFGTNMHIYCVYEFFKSLTLSGLMCLFFILVSTLSYVTLLSRVILVLFLKPWTWWITVIPNRNHLLKTQQMLQTKLIKYTYLMLCTVFPISNMECIIALYAIVWISFPV